MQIAPPPPDWHSDLLVWIVALVGVNVLLEIAGLVLLVGILKGGL